jgi:hypothetical protein
MNRVKNGKPSESQQAKPHYVAESAAERNRSSPSEGSAIAAGGSGRGAYNGASMAAMGSRGSQDAPGIFRVVSNQDWLTAIGALIECANNQQHPAIAALLRIGNRS